MTEGKIKAKIPSRYGMVEIEGNPEDVQRFLNTINGKKNDKSIKFLLLDLIGMGYFNTPRTLTEIRLELERKGYNYPSSSLFPVLHRDILREGYLEREGKRRTYKYFASEIQRKTASEVLRTIKWSIAK